MVGTKLLGLACAVSLSACAGAASQGEPRGSGQTAAFATLTPKQRMPVIAAKNALAVSRSRVLDARDAYVKLRFKLEAAQRRRAPAELVAALQRRIGELRARLEYRRAVEREKQLGLRLARARLAKEHKLPSVGSVKRLTAEHAGAVKEVDAAKNGIDAEVARVMVADGWRLAAQTSHNHASRLGKAVEFFEAMAKTVAKSKGNCRLMVRGLRELYRRHPVLVSRLRDGASGPLKIKPALRRQFRPRADAATRQIREAVIPCINEPDVQYLMGRVRPRR